MESKRRECFKRKDEESGVNHCQEDKYAEAQKVCIVLDKNEVIRMGVWSGITVSSKVGRQVAGDQGASMR